MNRSELRAVVKANIGNRDDKDDLIDIALDLGIREFAKVHFFDELISESDLAIVEDDQSVDLPTTFFKVLFAGVIDSTSSFPFVFKSKNWVRERVPNVSALSTGKPSFGYVEKGTIYLYPVCNDSYTLRVTYSTLPAAFASDATEIQVTGLDEALINWTTGWIFRSMQLYEDSAQWFSFA